MSSERRARADDEAEGPAALSNFLTDTLRPPRPEPAEAVEPAAEEAPPAAMDGTAGEPWDDGGERTPALGTTLDTAEGSESSSRLAHGPLPAIDYPGEPIGGEVETEEPPESEPAADSEADADAPLEDRPFVAAPIMPASDEAPDLDDPDPAALFLARERSARRTQRIAAAAVVVCLLLLCGGYLLLRGRASAPEAQAAEAPVAAPAPQTPVAAKPAEPAPLENTEADVPEEGVVPGTKGGFSAALKAPGSPSAEPFVPGGPSTARYPDLPRDVLIQLENAASTEKQR